MFYSGGEFGSGTLERAELDTEYHAHSPTVTAWEKTHATMLPLFCHPSVMCHFLSDPHASVSKILHPGDLDVLCDYVLRSLWGQICS